MDSITAFSLAGTILQFVDSGTRLVTLAWSQYRRLPDGDNHYSQLQKVTESLVTILPDLRVPTHAIVGTNGFCQLTIECERTASELLDILKKTRAEEATRKRNVIKTAFRIVCDQSEVQRLEDQMLSFRNQLTFLLLASLREYASNSVQQQETIVKQLGIAREDNSNFQGSAMSILEYLVSKFDNSSDRIVKLQQLRNELLDKISFSETTMEPCTSTHITLPLAAHQEVIDTFLNILYYDGMIDREGRIAEAHETTFQWIFQDEDIETQLKARCSSLRTWLESSLQLYWITGKPGSGKSTLLKFLCYSMNGEPYQAIPRNSDDRKQQKSCRCRPYLDKWAGESRLVIVSCYFWNSGIKLQRTQVGMLRTILYQIVKQCGDLLPIIAPKFWESTCLFRCQSPADVELHKDELYKLVVRAVKALGKSSRICFFVDGLDEFDDDHGQLVGMIHDLINGNDHIKFCVASRPWNVFQDAFGQRPSLRLEDLTYNDIKGFVQSKFQANQDFKDLQTRYPSFAYQLIHNIVSKASGVFLWVDLVVASLLTGMQHGDRIEDFQRRLDALPPDLESLYEVMLESIDPFYREQAAQHFSLVEAANYPLTTLQFSFADEESPASVIGMNSNSFTEDQISVRVEAVLRRINSRCRGFLELHQQLHNGKELRVAFHPSNGTIQYIHRTVRDFIRNSRASRLLPSSESTCFNAKLQILVAYLINLKILLTSPVVLEYDWSIPERANKNVMNWRYVRRQMHFDVREVYSLLIQIRNDPQVEEVVVRILLDEFTNIINGELYQKLTRHRFKDLLSYHFSAMYQKISIDDLLLCLAVRLGSILYLRANAQNHGLVCIAHSAQGRNSQRQQWPLLMIAVSLDVPSPHMIQCLLSRGADPNFQVSKLPVDTPWIWALTQVASLHLIEPENGLSERYLHAYNSWKETLRLMIEHGADCSNIPQARLTSISRKLLEEVQLEMKSGSLPSH